MTDKKVIRTERGWAGHFICADKCKYRRNTLLNYDDIYIVVSTVGNLVFLGKREEIGCDRYYETMAFFSRDEDKIYHDANVEKQIYFDSNWRLGEDNIDWGKVDLQADEMHETVVKEITEKLEKGEIKK